MQGTSLASDSARILATATWVSLSILGTAFNISKFVSFPHKNVRFSKIQTINDYLFLNSNLAFLGKHFKLIVLIIRFKGNLLALVHGPKLAIFISVQCRHTSSCENKRSFRIALRSHFSNLDKAQHAFQLRQTVSAS